MSAPPAFGFIVRRLLFLLPVVLGVSLITFAISHVVPGDPARLMAGPGASAELVDAMRHELGLDRPVYIQYIRYIDDLVHGDLGISIQTRRPVSVDLLGRFPATIELMLSAFLLSFLVGIPLGIFSAVYKDKVFDHVTRMVSVLGISIPSYWLALVLVFFLYGKWDLLPGSGRMSGAIDPPVGITGFYMLDSLLTGNFRSFADAVSHLFLPTLTLSLVSIGAVVRLVRASMIEVLGEDYIRMARACGIPRRTVLFNLALRNALTPVITIVGLSLANMLYGAVVIETIFSWPGTGSYVVNAILNLDFPVIMAFTLVVSIAYVLINLAVDLVYMIVDPQVKEAG